MLGLFRDWDSLGFRLLLEEASGRLAQNDALLQSIKLRSKDHGVFDCMDSILTDVCAKDLLLGCEFAEARNYLILEPDIEV